MVGRRVAAFGYHAGFAGTAVGLEAWARHVLTPRGTKILHPPIRPFPHEDDLIEYTKSRMDATGTMITYARGEVNEMVVSRFGRLPKVMVIGALGRCGTGAVDFAKRVGLPE